MSGRCCCGSVWKARSLAGIEVIAKKRYEGTAALTSGVRSITLARHDERPPCDISINDYRLQYSTVHMISRELAQSIHSPQHPAFDVFRNATSLDLPSGRNVLETGVWSCGVRVNMVPLLLEVLSILEAMYSSGPDFCYETLSQSQSMLLWCAIVARLVNREISLSVLPSEESAMLFLHGRLLSVLPRGASSTLWWWYVCAHLLVTENRGSRMAAATWQEPQFRR